MLKKSRTFPTLLIFIFFLIGFFIAKAQETRQYSGDYSLVGFLGTATYDYIIKEGDTLIDGRFYMDKDALPQLLLKEGDNSFLFSGRFNQGKPVGFWLMQHGYYKAQRSGQLKRFTYELPLNGTQWKALGNIKEGKPDGAWVISVDSVVASDMATNKFKSDFQFSNGIPQGSFCIEDEERSLVGRTLRNGLAQGEWTLFSDQSIEPIEKWSFEEGFLRRITFNGKNEARTVPFYGTSVPSNFITTNLDEDILYLLTDQLQIEEKLNSPIASMLKLNEGHYHFIDERLNALGKANFTTNIQIKLPYFPLDSTNLTFVGNIVENYHKSTELLNVLMNDTHLNIIKRSDEEVGFLLKVAEHLSNDYLDLIEKVVVYQEKELLQYTAHIDLVERLWPQGLPKNEITIFSDTKEPQVFKESNGESTTFEGDGLKLIHAISDFTLTSTERIYGVLEERMKEGKRIRALATLEERLLEKNTMLEKKVDSTDKELPILHKNGMVAIKVFADNELKTFSKLPENQSKLDFGIRLEQCLGYLNDLAAAVLSQPNEEKYIKELYTDQMWNPFMMTLMDESLKKSIVSAYQGILIPHFLNNIQSELSCDMAKKFVFQMKTTYERVTELRDQDTGKLERKLRKAKEAEPIMKLLGIQQSKNTK